MITYLINHKKTLTGRMPMTTKNQTLRPGTAPDIKYKDTVFRKLFSDPARLLELYNAMNKSN